MVNYYLISRHIGANFKFKYVHEIKLSKEKFKRFT